MKFLVTMRDQQYNVLVQRNSLDEIEKHLNLNNTKG